MDALKSNHNRISLCMIVRNEEQNLAQCLASIAGLISEIVIVDTGSTDRTKNIAANFGGKIFDFKWTDDFAAARNFGLQQARGDWLLVLDADEYLEPANAAMILELTGRPDSPDVYLLPIKSPVVPEFQEWQTTMVLRLFKNNPDLRFQGKIHEQVIVPPDKKVEFAEKGPCIIHNPCNDNTRLLKSRRNMAMLQKLLSEEPEQPYYHYYIGLEYIAQENFKKALYHMRKALTGIPRDVLLFRVSAVKNAVLCYGKLNKLAKAEKLLRLEIKFFHNFPDLYYCLGNVYRAKGDFNRAIEYFDQALNIKDPPVIGCGLAGANGYKSLFYRGLCLEELRCYFDAQDSFLAALKENPFFIVPLANLIKCLLFTGGVDECLQYLNANLNILSPSIQLLVAQLLFAAGQFAAAKSLAENLDNLNLANNKSLLLGEIALASGCPEEALMQFEKIFAGEPTYSLSLVYKCFCAWKLKRPADIEIIKQLSKIMPNQPVAKFMTFLNSTFTGQAAALHTMMDKNQFAEGLNFARQLLVKLLEFKMLSQAEIISQWLANGKPELIYELLYVHLNSGFFQQAENLKEKLQQNPAFNIIDPQHSLEMAKIYTRISGEFQRSVPLLGRPS